MSFLLLVFLMTADGIKITHIPEPDKATCQSMADRLNRFEGKVKADCVEVVK